MAKDKHKHLHLQTKKPHDSLDLLVYFFTFATPLFEVPQVLEIYLRHSAQDVSIWTWAFFCIDNIVWIAYALRKRIMPVLITSILYEIFELAIFIGILIYK